MKLKEKIITVRVNREDITLGSPNSPWSCPIARAIRRATGIDDIAVSSKIKLGKHYLMQKNPVEKRMDDYDLEHYMTPFSFQLRLIPRKRKK